MRITLSIDDDVLAAARALAAARGRRVGEVLSDLARQGLSLLSPSYATRNGIPLLPRKAGGGPVSPDLVRSLLCEDG